MESLLGMRYPPFTEKNIKEYAKMSDMTPNFDRQGRTIGWGRWFLGLLGLKSLAAVVGK